LTNEAAEYLCKNINIGGANSALYTSFLKLFRLPITKVREFINWGQILDCTLVSAFWNHTKEKSLTVFRRNFLKRYIELYLNGCNTDELTADYKHFV